MYPFLLITLFILTNSTSIIHLPFYRIIPSSSNINPEIFPSLYFETNYYTNVSIGSNYQTIPMRLSFKYYHSFITIKNYTGGDFIKFDPEKSNTYEKMNFGERFFVFINIRKGIDSKERFNLKSKDNKFIYCDNIEFLLATDLVDNISGDLGMKLSTKDEQFNRLLNFSFIINLHKNNYIKHQIFSINFFNENKGEIIIGNSPDDYSNLDIGTYKYSYVPINDDGYSWGFKDLVSYLDKKKINIKFEYAEFQIESNIISPVHNYLQKINETFFNNLSNDNKCIFVNNNNYFHFYHCDQNINITNFPILKIYQKDINYTFELSSDDLFEDIGDRKYFLVNFFYNNDNKWILGKPFLKKYNFTYNFDSKTVGLFFGTKEKKPYKEEFNKVWIFVIVFGVIIIILSGVIIFLVKKLPRKKRVNELEENFDYKENKNEGNNSLINNENQNAFGI
jgi:hypothetical protein